MDDEFWRCWPWLAQALRRGRDVEVSPESLLALLRSNRAQLWPTDGGALVTQLHVTPKGRCVHVWLGGGSITALVALRPGVEAWARAQGCELATIDGRRGWERVFRPLGYTPDGEELVKHL